VSEFGKKLESYDESQFFLFSPTRDDMRRADRSATLNQITTYIKQSLIDFQGKWERTRRGAWVIAFPNARYLSVGDKIRNYTAQKTYIVSEVIEEAGKGGIVKLNNLGAPAIVDGDILLLEEKNTVNFESSYSKYIQERPVAEWRDTIVYRVKRREPGTIGKHPFDPPTEIKPRVREYSIDQDHPGCHIMVSGQWFDNLIQFDCWSKLNNSADSLVEWFEDFMFKYTWVWKKNGVNEILYWMRNIDLESTKFRNDLAVRSTTYYFRTETITTIREYDLKQIDFYLSAAPSGFIGVDIVTDAWASGKVEITEKIL